MPNGEKDEPENMIGAVGERLEFRTAQDSPKRIARGASTSRPAPWVSSDQATGHARQRWSVRQMAQVWFVTGASRGWVSRSHKR